MRFNQIPYFDDFDPAKHFVKVLFRPARPIQARELNTIQSIFQHQVKMFADHVFKNGSRVSDGRVSFIRYNAIAIPPGTVTTFLYEGVTLVGQTSGQIARYIARFDDTVCITYIGSNSSRTKSAFAQDENIQALADDGTYLGTFKTLNSPNFTTQVDVFVVEKGVFYYNGYFIENDRQIIPVNLNDNFDIGFQVVEKIITPAEDQTLLDNNTSVMSYLNPGADRYQMSLVLSLRDNAAEQVDQPQNLYETTNGFIVLASVRNGVKRFIRADSEYNKLGNMLAQRTYEESGNYVVNPFTLSLKEHKAKSITDESGLDINGSEDNYVAVLGPGVGYVRGFRVETNSKVNLIARKARDTNSKAGFVKQFETRSYVKAIPRVNTSVFPNSPSSILINDGSEILLYDAVLSASNIPTGNLIGRIKICDMMADGKTTETTPRTIYRYFVSDLKMNPGKKLSDVKAMYNASATFAADVYIDEITGTFTLHKAGNTEFLWEIDKQYIKSLRDRDNPTRGSITYTYRKKLRATLDSAGTAIFNAPTGEYFKPFNNNTIGVITSAGVNAKIDITAGNTTYSPEKLIVSLGAANSGKRITIITDVVATNVTEKTKEIRSQVELFTDTTQTSYTLQRSDIIEYKVYAYDKTQPENSAVWVDVTPNFTLFNGQTDTAYVNATITKKSTPMPITINPAIHGFRIEYKYFFHSGNAGYFTVDSYSSIPYSSIPSYKATNGRTYLLSECFDFRPLIINTVLQSHATFPSIGQIAMFDIEYYVGRVDSVVLRKDGAVTIHYGQPNENPVPAQLDDDYMALYHLWLEPYTSSLASIKIQFVENRRYTMRDINKIDDRLRSIEYYTALSLLEKSAADMAIKDINGLDRFKNGFVVDDFRNFQAGDPTSNEFKACIDANRRELRPSYTARSRKMKLDPNHSYGYTLIDGMAYMPFYSEIVDQQPFATKNISINPYFMFSKRGVMRLTPNNDNWADTTREPNRQVNIDTGMTQALQNVADYNRVGITFGAWTEVNRTLINTDVNVNTTVTQADIRRVAVVAAPPVSGGQAPVSISTSGTAPVRVANGGNITLTNGGQVSVTTGIATTTTTTTTTTDTFAVDQIRTRFGIEMSSRTDTYNAGDRVLDVTIQPFMRSIDIEFFAERMLENTKVYAFFDGQPVSKFCRPIDGMFGDQLFVNERGQCHGVFRIPEGTFFVGKKIFTLTGDPLNEGNVDTEFTRASASFFAGGISVTKEQLELNVVTPVYNFIDDIERRTTNVDISRTVVSTVTTENVQTQTINIPGTLIITAMNQRRVISNFFPQPPFVFNGTEFTVEGLRPGDVVSRVNLSSDGAAATSAGQWPINISGAVINNPGNYTNIIYRPGVFTVEIQQDPANNADPVAQSFKLTNDRFITGLDIYFQRVDLSSKEVWVELRTMKNGYPTNKALATKSFKPEEIAPFVSDDASVPFHVDFKFPVYVKANEEYCFVVGGSSPGTRIWVARLGDVDITNPNRIVETQPTLGSSFRSQNGSTWNAEQYEDIKYRLYAAVFTTDEMNLSFMIEPEFEKLEQDPFECEAGVKVIRVYMKDHGMSVGDIVTLSMFKDQDYIITISGENPPAFDQTITTSTGSAKIYDITRINATQYKLRLKELNGLILTGQRFTCPSEIIRGAVATHVSGEITNAPVGTINGINLDELNGDVVVKSIDSNNSFLIDIESTPTQSGRFGGNGVEILANYRYEIHNSSGQYEKYSCDETWWFHGIDMAYNKTPGKQIVMKTDYHLDSSNKLANKKNEVAMGVSSINLNGRFTSTNPYVTPVINTETFTTVFVSNSVDTADQTVINVKPNSVGRYQPETHPNQGSHSYKYVTRKITLSKPATDLRIAFDVYKDVNADFDVYVKTQEQYNTDNIDDYEWKLVSIKTKRNSVNLEDRIEYELDCSDLVSGWAENFIAFKVKLVGRTSNPAKPPLFQNLRIIAFT